MTPISPIRASTDWTPSSQPGVTAPPRTEETDQITLTAAAQAILDEPDLPPPEDDEGGAEVIEGLYLVDDVPEDVDPLEEADTEEVARPIEAVLDALVLTRLRQEDSRIRGDGIAVPADALFQLGPDDRWYAIGGGAGILEEPPRPSGGLTEFGPLAHSHGEDCAYCARSAAQYAAMDSAGSRTPGDTEDT
jgi:hypothetical protein